MLYKTGHIQKTTIWLSVHISVLMSVHKLVQVRISFSDSNGVGGVTRVRPKGAPPAADSRLEFAAGLQLAAQRPQDVQKLTPELHTNKGIQDGIEAAVKVTHGGGDYLGFLQRCSHCTSPDAVVRLKRVHHKCDIVWCPADKENHHHSHDYPDSFLLLKALGSALQPPQDAGVAEDQNSRR